MSRYIIAYDLGTGGNKASLYTEEGNCVASEFVPYETIYPEVGWHEQRPMDWWKAIVESTQNLLSNSKIDKDKIECLAISGHSMGVVPIDKHGNLLREKTPIWSDTRAKKQVENFFEKVDPDEWYYITGNGFSRQCYAIFKIMWYRDNEPEMFSKIYKVVGTKDFINFKLTGKIKTDFSYASGSGIYNLLNREYSKKLINSSGLPIEIFPDIVPSTEILGELSSEAVELMNLPKKLKVLCGGVDNSCMALGAANISEGKVYLSLGSSAWIAVSSEHPVLDKQIKPFVFDHVVPNMYTSATSIFSAGNSFKWIRDNICINLKEAAEKEGKSTYEKMEELANKSPIGANKLLFSPSMAGGSAANLSPNIKGGFLGLDLAHTQSDLIMATMEGIAMDLCIMYKKLKKLCKLTNEVLMVGGGSKSSFWRQIFANVFNSTIVKANIDQEVGSLGAAAVAAVGTGLWKDFNKINEILKREDITKPEAKAVKKYKKLLSIYSFTLRFQADLGDMIADINI